MLIKIALSVLILAAQALDGWTTYKGLRRGSIFERNPLVAWTIDRIGLYPALLLWKGWVGVVLGWGWWYGAWAGDVGTGILLGLFLFYGWVVANNLKILEG